jgi:hypothetical protein
MKRCLLNCIGALLLTMTPASAQLSTALDVQSSHNSRFTFVTMGGLQDLTNTHASGLLGARTSFDMRRMRFGVDAALLTSASARTAAAVGMTAGTHWRGLDAQLRLIAAAQPGDTLRRTTGVGVEVGRNGAFFALRANIAPGRNATYRDTVLHLEADTTFTARILDKPGERAHVFNDIQAGYRYFRGRLDLGAMINARVAPSYRTELSGAVSASGRIVAGASAGFSIAREPGNDWLGRSARMTGMFFVRMDAPRRTPFGTRTVERGPYMRVATAGETVITVESPGHTLEIAGDFSDWNPVPLVRTSEGHWEARMSLPAGVYHVSIRIDGGEWMAPRGLPAVADDLGGTTAIFEVG